MYQLKRLYFANIVALFLLCSCATVPPPVPQDKIHGFNHASRAMNLYSQSRLAALDGDYPAALNLLREAIQMDPESAFLHFAAGDMKLKIGQTAEALDFLKKAIQLDPSYRPPFVMAGSIMAAAGKDWDAADYLRKAVKLDPSKEDAYLHLAISLTRLYEYEEAVASLKNLIKLNNDSVLGYYYLGKTYSQMKLHRDAAAYFKKSLELRPEFTQAAIDMAVSHEALGEIPIAIEIYQQVVGNDEDKITVLQRLIQLLIQQRRFEEALRYLNIAADNGYGGPEIMRKIGLIHLELEQFDEAIKVFNGMLEKDGNSDQIRFYIGVALEEKGELDQALSKFSSISHNNIPLYTESIGHIAYILKEQGKPLDAVEILKKSIADHPRELELYMKLSSLYDALELTDAGIRLLYEAEKIFPDDPRLQFRIGVIYDKQGKRAESIERMKRVIAHNAKDAQALNFLGYSYAEMGINLDEALMYLKQAVAIRPNDGFILDSLGWVYFKLKQYDEAVRYLEAAVALVEDDSTIAEHLADAYTARHEKSKAIKMYKKALELEPDRKELATKIRQLKGEHVER